MDQRQDKIWLQRLKDGSGDYFAVQLTFWLLLSSIGVVGTIFAPLLPAIGALAALIRECTITVGREQ